MAVRANSVGSPAERVVSMLDRCRETGSGTWLASCPGPIHERGDRHPSLSIRETGDGTLLLWCGAGCTAAEIVGALGLTLADLFPESGAEQRPPLRRGARRVPARDALAVLDSEALLVAVVASDLRQHRAIDSSTWDRLAVAVARIGRAREAAR